MVVELVALGKVIGGRALAYAASWVKGGLAKRRASKNAIRGDDLASEGRLEHLVRSELEKLATSSELPQELQTDSFRAWLLTADCVERFCEVMIARSGGEPALSKLACDELARRYEQATGETRRLATGPLNLAVSWVYGQLRATESSRDAFNSALALRTAAQTHFLLHSELRPFPTTLDIERLQRLSALLLAAGRTSWKMPTFVAPLTLEAQEEKGDKENHSITTGQLAEAIESGDNIVLFGDGGIGKTTFLLELASLFTPELRGRTPLFVDAAIWAHSGDSILHHIAGNPSAQALNLTPGVLARFAESGRLVLMVNGWNEVPSNLKAYCRETFNLLTTAAPALSVVVTSRTAHDAPNISSARRIAVRGLTWTGQSAVVRSELEEEAAHSLLEVLARDTRLRHAARSPLILRGLIAKSRNGAETSSTVYDILGAVVTTFERDENRSLKLAETPLFNMQGHYLEEIACSLNARGATNLTRDEALVALTEAARCMLSQGLLGTLPQPATVLDVLVSHHLLHFQDTFVRFAHQRFQEYFAAARLLRIESLDDKLMPLLRAAMNEPAWADSLELVAGKLKGPCGSAIARARLVQTAERVDLAYACELAGLCAFQESDDVMLHRRMVLRVNELRASPLLEVQELAIASQIASSFPEFADQLWTLFESEDQQTRLQSHRLNGSSVSIAQLGPRAAARINEWPSAQRAELIHEIVENPDNFDYIARIAFEEADSDVRAAAIAALFWHYPASTVAIKAWLNAPIEVQTKHDLVSCIVDDIDQGVVDEQVRKHLRVIEAGDISDDLRLQLVLAFPDEVGPVAIEVVLDRLKTIERHGDPDPLVSIAKVHSPDRLRTLAIELVVSQGGTPEWVGVALNGETPEVREMAFERAWRSLEVRDGLRLRPEIVGPLSNLRQTARSVATCLRERLEPYSTLSSDEHDTARKVESLLAHAPGNDMLSVVMELGVKATYEQAVELVDLLLARISRDENREPQENPWLMTTQQFNLLYRLFNQMTEEVRYPQDKLFVLLACIASHVEPTELGSILLGALRRQLDAWTTYRTLMEKWARGPRTPRPNNPSLGNYVISALARWGMGALPGVLQLMEHPNASDLVPEAVGHIAGLPWAGTRNKMFNGVGTDILEGKQRRDAGRQLQQPSAAQQLATDEAARTLAKFLNDDVDRQLVEKETNPKWNAKRVEHRIGRLVSILANLPSAEIISPVTRALNSGLVGLHSFIDALRGLTRQGWVFSNPSVVNSFEALYERETNPERAHERYELAQLNQLMFLVEPVTLLKWPLSHYLSQWQRYAHPSEVIQALGDLKNGQAFPALLSLVREISGKGQPTDDAIFALGSALSSNRFIEFTRLVEDGTLFSWCRNDWTVQHLAQSVASVVKDVPGHLHLLVDSCQKNTSPMADALLGKVLSEVDGQDDKRMDFGLNALDAGRANDINQPAYRMLLGLFTLQVPADSNWQEAFPKSCNSLRRQLYYRAKAGGESATAACRLLASVECRRREYGRPADESRHPDVTDGLPWTDVL